MESGNKPITRAPVTLFKTTGGQSGPLAIGKDRTNGEGDFSVNYRAPRHGNAMLYVVSGVPGTDRWREVRLAALLGTRPRIRGE